MSWYSNSTCMHVSSLLTHDGFECIEWLRGPCEVARLVRKSLDLDPDSDS